MIYIKALIKFSKEEQYRQDIIDGHIFFRAIRDVQKVNDPLDSSLSEFELNYNDTQGKIGIIDTRTASQPVCCFYNLNDSTESDKIKVAFDEKYKENIKNELGEYVTIIKDVPTFVDKIRQAHKNIWTGRCLYKNNILRRIPEFEKRSKFVAEQEFRFLIYDWLFAPNDDNFSLEYYKEYLILDKRLYLNIGSIKDIIETCTIDQLFQKEYIQVVFDKEKNNEKYLSNIDEYIKYYDL